MQLTMQDIIESDDIPFWRLFVISLGVLAMLAFSKATSKDHSE